MTAAEREKLVELWAKVPGCKDLPKIAATFPSVCVDDQ